MPSSSPPRAHQVNQRVSSSRTTPSSRRRRRHRPGSASNPTATPGWPVCRWRTSGASRSSRVPSSPGRLSSCCPGSMPRPSKRPDARAESTHVSLVATALRRLDPSVFECVLLGGSRVPDGLPPNVVATYGMTETGSGVVYDGWPLDGVEMAFRPSDGGPTAMDAGRRDRDPDPGPDAAPLLPGRRRRPGRRTRRRAGLVRHR